MIALGPFVLVVEDDAKLRRIIAQNLNAMGYLVFEAGSLAEAGEQIAVKPQLMILDINLPDATGWDVAKWLQGLTDPVPIIVISGMPADKARMDHFKPLAFLPKPFDMQELLALAQQAAPM